MLEGWANDVVIALAGVVIGSLLSAARLLSPVDYADLQQKPGEGFWENQRRRRREQDERLANAPRSYTLVSIAFFGFLTVFVTAIIVSPIQMKWWYFLAGAAAAFAAGELLPKLVASGKLPEATDEPLFAVLRRAASQAFSRQPPTGTPTGTGTPAA
jgi:hypothetical protein